MMSLGSRLAFEAMTGVLCRDWEFPPVMFENLPRVAARLHKAGIRFGVEREGWARDGEGNSVALDTLLGHGEGVMLRDGWVGPDGGFDHFEIASRDAELEQVMFTLNRLERAGLQLLPPGSRIAWTDHRPPNGMPARWNGTNVRHNSLADGLRAECRLLGIPEEAVEIVFLAEMCRRAATHYHLGGIDPLGPLGVDLLNRWNNVGTILTAVICDYFRLPANRNSIFRGWADPRRLPGPYWFRNAAEVEQFIISIPRLLAADSSGPDLLTPGNMDKVHLKSLWWLVRVSYHGTLEGRFCPSLPAAGVEAVLWIVACIVRMVLEGRGRELPRIDDATWWQHL